MTTAPSGNCPTPDKKRYATTQAAWARAPRAELVLGYPLYPYDRCPCGWIHLTKNPNAWTPTNPANPDGVDRLRHMNADQFTTLVSNDTKARLGREDRAALRHHHNLTRWRWTLKALRTDINQQIAQTRNGDPDWLRRAHRYRDTLTLRLTECQTLRTQTTANRRAA